MSAAFYETICKFIPEEHVLRNEPMSKHTTFQVGGNARYFITVQSKEQIVSLVKYFKQVEREFQIIGNGSNLLVSDQGYDGVIIKVAYPMNQLMREGNRIIADAGVTLERLSAFACENNLTGLEFASGIPGTLGGACVMNAGAYDGEMKQVVQKVVVCDYEGNILELDHDTMEFGYRKSIIRNKPFVVLEVWMELTPGNRETIQEKMDGFWQSRREKQPLEYPSAGSTFKRPEGHFAGKLIMDCGLRGFQIGGARVSDKHCGFVINTGTATANDIYQLIQEIKNNVKDKFGVELEQEVVMIGKFS